MIVAEEGLRTNYGTIPRILRPIFDPTRYNSYVIHDSAYTTHMKYSPILNEYQPMTRSEADLCLIQ